MLYVKSIQCTSIKLLHHCIPRTFPVQTNLLLVLSSHREELHNGRLGTESAWCLQGRTRCPPYLPQRAAP